MSDQDFFFDEEDEAAAPAAKDPSPAAAKRSQPAPAKRAAQPATASPAFFEQSVSMMVAALMTVIGLLVGVIIGFVIAPDGGGTVAPTTGSSVPAPQLSPEQLESGELPAGHPPVGEMGGSGETTGAGSVETTETE